MRKRLGFVVVTALAASLALTGCGKDSEGSTGNGAGSGTAKGKIAGAGASSQQAAVTAWKAQFEVKNSDASVNYDPVGSGGGREQFISKAVDFAGSDAALKEKQLEDAKARCGGEVIELPAYISPIAVAFNLDGVSSLNLSPQVMAKIFFQEIKKWNDPAIKADNPGVNLPDLKITVINRSDESGTTQNFTEYLNKASGGVWTAPASGTWPVAGGEAAKGTSGVANALKSAKGTIAYIDASQATGMGTAKVKVGTAWVGYTPAAAAKAVETATKVEGRSTHDHALNISRTPTDPSVYPVVLVSYTIACAKYDNKEKAELVKNWIKYIVSEEGQAAAAQQAGSAPISAQMRTQALAAAEAIKS